MSERDAELRRRTARLFWAMGSAVVLRVPLTAYDGGSKRTKARSQTPKDLSALDVLGVEVARDFGIGLRGAQCKSSRATTKELFWLRGATDYLGAADGYLVVQFDDTRTPAMREMASRLRLSVLTFNDFEALEAAYRPSLVADALFHADIAERTEQLLRPQHKDLERLTDYALRSSWQLPQHRNLQQAIAYLRGASRTLRPEERAHVLVFGELVFRYLLALYRLCGSIVRRGLPHTRELTLAYLHGGELGLLDARQRMRAVQSLQERLEGGGRQELRSAFSDAPPHFDALLDVVERLLRRPDLATDALRQLTIALRGVIVGEHPSWELLEGVDPLAGKLAIDVAAFLTRTAGVDRGLRDRLAWALETDREAVDARAESAAATVDASTPPRLDASRAIEEGRDRASFGNDSAGEAPTSDDAAKRDPETVASEPPSAAESLRSDDLAAADEGTSPQGSEQVQSDAENTQGREKKIPRPNAAQLQIADE